MSCGTSGRRTTSRSWGNSPASRRSRSNRSRCNRRVRSGWRRMRRRLARGQADSGGSELALTRVGKIADGWMTHSLSPDGFKRSWDFILKVNRENGRDVSRFDNVLYHHINVNADKQEALADSKKFLDLYCSADYTQARLESWLTYGSPRECVEHIKGFKASGCRRITFRISTMGDPMEQFRRLVEDVLPYVD